MITDKAANLHLYQGTIPYADKIAEFIARDQKERFPDGRYELEGEELFANIMCYETGSIEGKCMESHKLYDDLQYVASGCEWIYWDFADEMRVKEDRTPGADILFYEVRPNKGGNLLSEGMFGYYMPCDGHMPGVCDGRPASCRKIVFKIRRRNATD